MPWVAARRSREVGRQGAGSDGDPSDVEPSISTRRSARREDKHVPHPSGSSARTPWSVPGVCAPASDRSGGDVSRRQPALSTGQNSTRLRGSSARPGEETHRGVDRALPQTKSLTRARARARGGAKIMSRIGNDADDEAPPLRVGEAGARARRARVRRRLVEPSHRRPEARCRSPCARRCTRPGRGSSSAPRPRHARRRGPGSSAR